MTLVLPVLRNGHAALRSYAHLDTPLLNFPYVSSTTRIRNAKFIGAAGEFFVDSLLARFGISTWTTGEVQGADRAIEIALHRFRLQIKAVTAPSRGAYRFSMQRGYHRSNAGRRPYEQDAFDIAALVILPENAVAFAASGPTSFTIPFRTIPELKADPLLSLDASIGKVLRRKRAV